MANAGQFEAFFERTFAPLTGALWLYCGDRVVAEEFAQEALVRVARDWESVAVMRSPAGWTYRVAFNLANSYYRRKRIERRAVDRHNARPERTAGVEPVAEALVVRQAVGRLPARQREAIVLVYFADLSVSDVADVMSVPANTVKSWLARGRTSLENELAGEFATPLDREDADAS